MWPDEMRRKTVIKRLVKFLPCSPELAKAIEIDNAATGAIDTEFEIVPDADTVEGKLTAGTHKATSKKKPGRPMGKKNQPDAEPPAAQ